MNLTFAHRKATQMLAFFAQKQSGSINKLKALKLIFFADRYHLRLYGRPISNDRYLAMNYGPVASSCKDLAEMSDFLGSEEKSYAKRFIAPSDHGYQAISKVDVSEFSATDLEALEFTWNEYGNQSGFELAEASHEFPEWKQHEVRLASPDESRVPMNYSDFLENPPQGTDKMPPLTPAQQEDLRELLGELHEVESLWR